MTAALDETLQKYYQGETSMHGKVTITESSYIKQTLSDHPQSDSGGRNLDINHDSYFATHDDHK